METGWMIFDGENGINTLFNKTAHTRDEALVPFSSSNDKNQYIDFSGVTGEFSKIMSETVVEKTMDEDKLKSRIWSKMDECSEEDFQILFQIIQDIYYEEGKLLPINIKALNYIQGNDLQKKVALYLYDLFIAGTDLQEKYQKMEKAEDTNILEKLLFDSLEAQERNSNSNGNKSKAECLLPYVKKVFCKDYEILLKTPELYQKYIVRFLAYYYLFYISQLAVKLGKFEKGKREEIEKIYMTLYDEVVTRIRPGYEYGWKYVKDKISCMFSHSVVLEMLSHNKEGSHEDYISMFERFCGQEMDAETADEIIKLQSMYKAWIPTINYNGCRHDSSRDGECGTSNEIRRLFEVVDYQFRNNSSRKDRYQKFNKKFLTFAEKNFGKFRGSCGYTLSLQDFDIIMFTRIILLENEGKLRLDKLFEEFELRGFLFDRESRKKITDLYEKTNLLEKRSDSGEAQYVKYIL